MLALPPVCLVLIVLAVFLPTVRYDLTNYDEKIQLVENEMVRSLHPANLARIFTRPSITSYYPVRTLSFALDYAIWGYTATGYHLTNVVLHALNVLLVFRLCARLRRSDRGGNLDGDGRLPATLGAAFFAIHPVVVEPVAWVAGREELLMTLFALLCIHAHVSMHATAGRRRVKWHVTTALTCAGACASNAVAAAVPALLLAYDVAVAGRRRWRADAVAIWYCWAIAAATLAIKLLTDRTEGTPDGVADPVITPFTRLLIVLNTYRLNLSQLVWPADLTLIYSNIVPGRPLASGVIIGAMAVVLTSLLVWRVRRNGPLLFGLLWFLLALAPSSQVVPHHIFRADRFLYLPLVGLAVAAASALRAAHPSTPWRRPAVVVVGIVLAALTARSIVQVPVWRDTVTVFSDCIRLRPDGPRAFNNRGNAYADQRQYDLAIRDYARAIALAPEFAQAHYNRGNAYVEIGDFDRAVADFDRAISLRPRDAEAYYNRGLARAGKGELDAAIEDYTRAVTLDPGFADAWYNRANARVRRREWEQAVGDFDAAIRLRPDWVDAYNNRGNAHLEMRRLDRAIEDFTRAIALDPRYVRAYSNRGNARSVAGDIDGALRDYTRALQLCPDLIEALCGRSDLYARQGNAAAAEADLKTAIAADPQHAGARYRLGLVFAQLGRPAEAAGAYRETLRLRPDWPDAANNLAWLLATCPDESLRNGPEAVRWADAACRLRGSPDPLFLDTQAAALAETGRFAEAIETATKAAELARKAGRDKLAALIDARLVLYRTHRAYREPLNSPPASGPSSR